LTSTVFQPNFVALSHAFGRRPVLLLALFLFTLGALLCGISTTFTLMLCGRSIQGIGGGGIIVLTQILVTDLVPLRERGKYFSIISIVWAVGSVSGPVIGGAFAQNSSWRWIFWINFPICAIGFAGVISFLNLESRKNTLKERLMEIDYLGSVVGVASLTIFLIPITWGGVMYSWTSWQTLLPLITGAVGLIGFCLYEGTYATYTILPMHLFRNRSTSICYFTTFVHGVVLWSVLYYLPLYFEGVRGYDPIISGVAALPQTCTVIPCAVAVGFVAAKTGRYRWALWAGWALTTFGCGILYLLDGESTVTQCVFLQLGSGIGMGLLFPSMALSIQASAPQEDVAIAAALFCFFRGFGQTVGVAVGGVIFQNQVKIELGRFSDLAAVASQYSVDAVALVQTMRQLPSDLPQARHLKTGFADALQIIWVVMCGLSGIALFASFFVERYALDRAITTEQGFRDGSSREKEQV
jgi:EmrB/QacA subfamily drug resistance transporter